MTKDLNDCDSDSTSGSYSDSQDKPNYDSEDEYNYKVESQTVANYY